MDEKVIEEMARAARSYEYDAESYPWEEADEIEKEEYRKMMRAGYPFARAAALREAAGIVERAIEYGDSSRDIAAALLKEAETTEGK